MARSIHNATLETRTGRLKLSVSSKPVWTRIGDGLGLGYRRNRLAGTWVARIADGTGGYKTKNVGTADDYAEANGKTVLTYWQAQEKARRLGKGDASPRAAIVTLAHALDCYEADLRTRGGDPGNVSRLRYNLTPALLKTPVVLLSAEDLRRWRNSLVKRLAPATVNRVTTAAKAALNLLGDHDESITSRRPWEIGLATLAGAEQARNAILTEATVRRLIAEARIIGPEFGLLVEVAAVTGARVGQLARLEVQDLVGKDDSARLMIPSSAKGKGVKQVRNYNVPIPPALAARLRIAAGQRPATAPLLTKPSGDRWRRSDHSRPFRRACHAAGEDPSEVTVYALRHSSIVRQILANVPIRVVATGHDTSVAMIEKNYARFIQGHTDALVRTTLLDVDESEAKVIPIRR